MMKRRTARKKGRHTILFLMALPAMLVTFLLSYIPMVGIILAFKKLNYTQGIFFSPWAGFDNFRFFVVSGKALMVTVNTIIFNFMFIIGVNLAAIIIAIFVAEMSGRKFKKTMQSFMFLPFFISWVVVGAFMYNLFNVDTGLVNGILKQVGGGELNIYGKPFYWYIIMPVVRIWKFAGYNSVIYLAAIMGIDGELLEAAIIDGANRFQRIFRIILPLLKPTIILMIMLSLGGILRGDFDMFYNLIGNNSLVYSKTDIIDTFVFRSIINSGDIGMTSAASFFQSVFCFIFIFVTNSIVRRINSDYALY